MENKEFQESFQSIKDYRAQVQEIVSGRMRSAMTDMVYQLFEEELEFICGPRYSRGSES